MAKKSRQRSHAKIEGYLSRTDHEDRDTWMEELGRNLSDRGSSPVCDGRLAIGKVCDDTVLYHSRSSHDLRGKIESRMRD